MVVSGQLSYTPIIQGKEEIKNWISKKQADFYDVDVREIIEGERKSEMMDKEIREVATKMADYANEEKSKLLKSVQIISFVGVLVLLLSIGLQTVGKASNQINKGVLFVTFIALVVMSIVTLYVTGLLEKITKNKKLVRGIKIVTIAGLVVAFWRVVVMTIIVGVLLIAVELSPIEVYDDVSQYYALTDGKGRIIYGEQIFCNYFMDLDYNEYIPKEYLLDGFNATTQSEYYKKMSRNK